eukprot:1161895-Pelagomonas_calceolata.AAC.1
MLVENVSPAADQSESRALGQPPCNPCNHVCVLHACGTLGQFEGWDMLICAAIGKALPVAVKEYPRCKAKKVAESGYFALPRKQ